MVLLKLAVRAVTSDEREQLSEDLAEAVVGNEILPQLVYSLSEQNVSRKTFT